MDLTVINVVHELRCIGLSLKQFPAILAAFKYFVQLQNCVETEACLKNNVCFGYFCRADKYS